MASEDVTFLAERLADPATQWSLGTFGAIAEFCRDPDEPVTADCQGTPLSAVTARGGIRLTPPAGTRLFASETPTRESWSQRVALCLPQAECAMSRRTVVTEIGADSAALREADREAILFDLGLGALQVDICVRTADPTLLAALRQGVGRSIFEPENPAMRAILAASPHRVFIGRIGRAEVFQPIPPPHGKSPEGPHTHLLPKLLAHGRSHPATEPAPEGWVPCGHCYPAHPAKDAQGLPRPFDAAAHAAFQEMLSRFGDPALVTLKQQTAAAIRSGGDPAGVPVTDKRHARANVRIALRQCAAAGIDTAALAAWRAMHDTAAAEAEAADPYGHSG